MVATATVRPGYMCRGYDIADPAYTAEYDWQYCAGLRVGLTYEIHWPFSSAGSCDGRLTDGLGGVFCTSATPSGVAVQAQVFTIVNDARYDVESLISGMNLTLAADDIAVYSGSTTGTAYNNVECSPYAPVSWFVDRTCHKVSARSFDAMCREMKEVHGMTADLHPHGSRELVLSEWATSTPMT